MLSRLVSRLGRIALERTESVHPWTNVYGVVRTLLALGTLGTLLFSHSSALFRPAAGISAAPICYGVSRLSLFCWVPPTHVEIARWVAIALLMVVASGWRPRVTGILHWWLAFSLNATAIVVDGGDQITAILTLLLIPVTLTDRRRWHWEHSHERVESERDVARRLIAFSAIWAIRIQVAVIYFHAAVAKVAVEEWADGTAAYYWFTHPTVGMAPWLEPILMPFLTHPIGVTAITWGAIAVEVLLFTGLVMDRRYRPLLLGVGLTFHAAIAVVHGLISFVLAMWAALILYLRPPEEAFRTARLRLPAVQRLLERVRVPKREGSAAAAGAAAVGSPGNDGSRGGPWSR